MNMSECWKARDYQLEGIPNMWKLDEIMPSWECVTWKDEAKAIDIGCFRVHPLHPCTCRILHEAEWYFQQQQVCDMLDNQAYDAVVGISTT